MYKSKKKKVAKSAFLPESEEQNTMASTKTVLDSDFLAILINIQEKLNSPVFNGGFETLAASVEDIKLSQHKTEEHITSINKTIYEPDQGLFSRIKAAEKKQEDNDNTLKHEIAEMKTQLISLNETRANQRKLLWIVIPGSLGLVIKTLWDVISAHITLK